MGLINSSERDVLGIVFLGGYFVSFRKVNTYRLELTRRKQKNRNGNTQKKKMQPAVVFPEQSSAKPPRGRVAREGFY